MLKGIFQFLVTGTVIFLSACGGKSIKDISKDTAAKDLSTNGNLDIPSDILSENFNQDTVNNETNPEIKPEYPACNLPQHCKWGEECANNKCAKPSNPPGDLASDFTLKNKNSKNKTYEVDQDITLSNEKGKTILLYFALAT